MSNRRKNCILQNASFKEVYIFLYFIIYLLYLLLIFTSFNTPNAVQYTLLKCITRTRKNLRKFTIKQKVHFHAPKWTFNLDPIWDEKWNYMNPCPVVFNLFIFP